MRRKVRQIQGFGNVIEGVTQPTGLKAVIEKFAKMDVKDCGCGKRKGRLNKEVSSNKKNDDELLNDKF